ncbi:MAG: M23 family metallopeptidase [Clostridiaceae bacterium]|nr:M23 family metallopeptidase [Clostridiaceae bacterium]
MDKICSYKNYLGIVIFIGIMWLLLPVMVRAEGIKSPTRASLSTGFGEEWGITHKGIDVASQSGEPIYSALDGTVSYAGFETGYGNLIQVSSDNNTVIYYGHCSSIEVKLKDVVSKGDLIGRVRVTGNGTGPHLHFEVRINGVAVNPTQYIE